MPTFRDNVSSQSFHHHHHHHHNQYLYKSERKNCIKCSELCCNLITKSSSMFKLELKFNFFTHKLFIFIISLFVKKKAELSVVGHSRKVQLQNVKKRLWYNVCLLSSTAIKGWKSHYLFFLRVLSPSRPYQALYGMVGWNCATLA